MNPTTLQELNTTGSPLQPNHQYNTTPRKKNETPNPTLSHISPNPFTSGTDKKAYRGTTPNGSRHCLLTQRNGGIESLMESERVEPYKRRLCTHTGVTVAVVNNKLTQFATYPLLKGLFTFTSTDTNTIFYDLFSEFKQLIEIGITNIRNKRPS